MNTFDYSRKEGESELELLFRVASDKDKNGWTWDNVAEVMNQLTHTSFGESTWRKRLNKFNRENGSYVAPMEMMNVHGVEREEIDSNLKQSRELEIAKIQYRDERTAWNKQNYNTARCEQKLDYLEQVLSNLGRVNFESYITPKIAGDDEMIIMLSDWHIGQCFDSFIGKYDSDIAKERIAQLLSSVKENAHLYNIKKAHICLCGDMVSGSIHKSVQVTNREDVIDQIKIATELVSSFCYECCKIFENVFMYSVVGNHSRIDKKEDAIHSERLDDIIAWAVDLTLKYPCENFHYLQHRNLDVGIVDVNACGNSYLLVHGDFDPATKSGASNLSMMIGFVPTAILRGHLHSPSFNEYNGVRVIQGGSLAGSGDQYTLEKRLFGKPSQTLLICNNQGIKAHIPVELN